MSALVLALVGLTSGCAKTMLTKEGYTPQQFEADKFDCEQKVVRVCPDGDGPCNHGEGRHAPLSVR